MDEKLKILNYDGSVTAVDPLKPWTPGEVCPTCGGTGKDPQEGVCPECNGYGHDGRYEELMGKSPIEAARETVKMLQEADRKIMAIFGVPQSIIAPNPEYQFQKSEYRHPTKGSHEDSKKRRQMASRSRKINRRK